uniref:CCHC-type domain-containing protein n=1 Tax=Gasterosteus aculeatus aculeatus TaxID=481459 RepID=A0AAQ4P822_GASAC
MNPADPEHTEPETPTPSNMLQRHEHQLHFMAEAMQSMSARHESRMESLRDHLRNLAAVTRNPDVTPAVTRVPPSDPMSDARLPPPERCSGAPGSCRPFLVQCSLAFELQPSAFPTERSRVAYIVSLLTGRARDWGTAEWAKQSSICSSVASFSAAMQRVFDHATPGWEAARGLFGLQQGTQSVSDYSIDFHTMAAESDWNQASLCDAFYHGLSSREKDKLAARDLPAGLDELVALSIRIDSHLRERRRERVAYAALGSPPRQLPEPRRAPTEVGPDESIAGSEAMQLGRARLAPAERLHRLQGNQCMYCGQSGHYMNACPVKDRAHQSTRGRW